MIQAKAISVLVACALSATGSLAQEAIYVSPQPFVAEGPLPIPRASLELRKGKPVAEQLQAYGKRAGWDVVWEAPDYAVERDLTINGDFETALVEFLKGANEAGVNVRAVFYRGNKVVRVTEF